MTEKCPKLTDQSEEQEQNSEGVGLKLWTHSSETKTELSKLTFSFPVRSKQARGLRAVHLTVKG